MNDSASTNQTMMKDYKCLGCANLQNSLMEIRDNNASNHSDSMDLCICTDDIYSKTDVWKEVPELRWMLLTYALCIALGSIGNAVTLITMATADRKTKTVTNLFLISLTISDLLLLFVAAPMDMLQFFARGFDSGGGACKIAEYSRVLSAVASIMNMLAVTVERFIVIVMPMKARSICTMSNSRKSLVVVWGLSLILAAPILLTKSVYPLHFGDKEGNHVTQYYCNDFDDGMSLIYAIYQLVVCFALPALLMIVCYSVVIKALWKSNKNMCMLANATSSTTKPHISSPNELSRRKTVAVVVSTTSGDNKKLSHSLTTQKAIHAQLDARPKIKQSQACSESIHENATNSSPNILSDAENQLTANSHKDSNNYTSHPDTTRSKNIHRTCQRVLSQPALHKNATISDNSQKADDVRQSRTQVIKMLICVIVLFLLCWGPRFIIEILMKIGAFKYTPHFYWTKVALFMLPFMHALFNPVVYFIMSRTFRQSALQKFRQCTGFIQHKRCEDSSPSRRTTQNNMKTEDVPLKEDDVNISKYASIQLSHQEKISPNVKP